MKRISVFAFALVGLSGWQAQATPGPGCDPTRPVVAHYGDASSASALGAPVACAVKTGFGGAETRVAVAPNGDVLQTPAIVGMGLFGTPLPAGQLPGAPTPEFVFMQNAGIGWSQNRGASWQLIKPNGNLCPQGDNDLYFDRVTGRLFYSCIFGPLSEPVSDWSLFYVPHGVLLTSPPAPAGYTRWNSTDMWGWLSENPRYTTAPAPAGRAQPVAGENMSYWCANFVNALAAVDRTCHRSFDGGVSWQFASIISSTPPQHSECGTSGESSGYPQGGPDGSLWLFLSCGGNNYLARSTDEAATWPLVKKLDGTPVTVPVSSGGSSGFTGPQLRVDADGNLYVVQTVGSSLLLRTSTDGGRTWQGPHNMTHPAARDKTFRGTAAAIGYEPGIVAVSYLVQRSTGGYDAYISVTRNGLDGSPVFYSARINPADKPMVTAPSLSDDFITLDVGPDGTPWAGFFSDCAKNPLDGSYVDGYCQYTGGTRVVPFVPPVMADAVKTMTMGSLQW